MHMKVSQQVSSLQYLHATFPNLFHPLWFDPPSSMCSVNYEMSCYVTFHSHPLLPSCTLKYCPKHTLSQMPIMYHLPLKWKSKFYIHTQMEGKFPLCHKVIWGMGNIAPLMSNNGTRCDWSTSHPSCCTPGEVIHGSHRTEDWVVPGPGINVLKKRWISYSSPEWNYNSSDIQPIALSLCQYICAKLVKVQCCVF